MATLHFKATTTATPEQFVAALTDFGPGRSKIFENSTDDELKVHSQGPTEADVTEAAQYAAIAELAVRLADFAASKGAADFIDKAGADFIDKAGADFIDKAGADFGPR